MDPDLQANAKEILQPVEVLATLELSGGGQNSSPASIYTDAFRVGSSLYQEVSQRIREYLEPQRAALDPGTLGDTEKSLRYLGVLKKMFNRLASTGNDNTFREILREHRSAQPKSEVYNISAFVFVQQILGYVWEIYPFVDEDANDNFCRELQILFWKQVENDPYVYVTLHVTTVMMCPYVLGLYEPEPEKRATMRELMRTLIATEEAKKNERYYDLISTVMHFFLILHASTGKKYEYVLAQIVLDKVRHTDVSEDISKAQVLHLEAVLQGLLKAFHRFKSGTVKSAVFTKEKTFLNLDTWEHITKFVDNIDQRYRPREFFGLKRYCRERPHYVKNA